MSSTQGKRTFSDEEEEKLQAALSLDKQALNLVLETSAFILEQVRGYREGFISFLFIAV